MLPTIHIRHDLVLPDNQQWQYRFTIQSETSNRLYTIDQHKRRNIGAAIAHEAVEIIAPDKVRRNAFCDAKVRRMLQKHFTKISPGVYAAKN